MTEPTIKEKTSYCDSVPCTIHDHSGWLDRVKDYNPNQPTIKEKIEKLLTDEVFNSEPCNIRLFATNVARLICEEMTGKYRKFHTPEIHTPVCGGRSCACIGYDCRVAQEMDKAQEILKALE